MDATVTIPTPKTPTHRNTTRDERLKVYTLYYDAHWSIDQIMLQLNLTRRQVEYALQHRLTPQKHLTGARPKLNTPMRKRLIEWITTNKKTRREDWYAVPSIFHWNVGYHAIRAALHKEGYVRRVARQKPPLTEEQRATRLRWALEHQNWTWEQWATILWSDESWVNPGRHRKVWVTRKRGSSEVFHPDCVEPRWQRRIGWMFWGCISGLYGKGVHMFWEKSTSSISQKTYCEQVVPLISDYLQSHPSLIFQQDNASGHTAKGTLRLMQQLGFQPIFWPPNSPDLNPIETLWDRIKDYIQEHYPDIHRNYRRLRATIVEAWEAISDDTIRDIIKEMPKRCQAVIDAQGGETMY